MSATLARNRRTNEAAERGYGIILSTGPDEFLVAGSDLHLSFATDPTSNEAVGLGTVEEGVFENGKWVPGRRLNGDEVMISYDVPALAAARQTGTGLRFGSGRPTILRVKLYRFK